MRSRSLILITIVLLASLSCQTAKLLPAFLMPHEKYSPEQSYWSSGKPVLISIDDSSQVAIVASIEGRALEMTVYIRNTSGNRFDADVKNISLYSFYNHQTHVTPETPCGGGETESASNGVLLIDANLEGWKTDLRSLSKSHLVQTPFLIKSKVFSASELLEKKDRDFLAVGIISAVASGLQTSLYTSQAARALTIYSAKQDAKNRAEQNSSLMGELTTGLFQRHTVWPNYSYMGQVNASLITSRQKMLRRGGPTGFIRNIALPSPDFYQVCADFGGKEHTFVFVEETEEEK